MIYDVRDCERVLVKVMQDEYTRLFIVEKVV